MIDRLDKKPDIFSNDSLDIAIILMFLFLNISLDFSKLLNSAMHGLHHVAHRLTITIFPFNSSNLNTSFFRVIKGSNPLILFISFLVSHDKHIINVKKCKELIIVLNYLYFCKNKLFSDNMKKQFTFILSFIFISFYSYSQSFNSIVTVNGLTCAMCSFSTQKSLEKLDFIKKITPDLEKTAFEIVFDDTKFIDFDMIQEKVEDAGFFIGNIKINFDEKLNPNNNDHAVYNNNLFHFIIANNKNSSTYNLIDKNFISENDFESFSEFTSHACYLTGSHNESCCSNHENLVSKKVFHLEPDSE